VTWLHTVFDTEDWGTPGGDIVTEAVLTEEVPGTGPYAFASEELTALVQGWADAPAGNYGLMLRTASTGAGTAQRFDSRENGTEANRPVLLVRYEVLPPEGEPEGEGAVEGEGLAEGAQEGEGGVEGALEGEGAGEGEGMTEGSTEGEGEGTDLDAAAQTLLDSFDGLDVDGDQRLELEDARRVLPGLSEEDFAALDVDGSGDVSLRELRDRLGVPQGRLSLSSERMEFGSVATNVDKEVTLYVSNTGDATLHLRLQVSEGAAFALSTLPTLSIAPGVQVNSRVRFVPLAEEAYTGQLTIDTQDGAEPVQVALSGEGFTLGAGGCFGDPSGPGGLDLELILLVGIGLLVITLSISRMNSPD